MEDEVSGADLLRGVTAAGRYESFERGDVVAGDAGSGGYGRPQEGGGRVGEDERVERGAVMRSKLVACRAGA